MRSNGGPTAAVRVNLTIMRLGCSFQVPKMFADRSARIAAGGLLWVGAIAQAK